MEVHSQGRRSSAVPQHAAAFARASWSPRARRVIEQQRALCLGWLAEPLHSCLGDFEQQLFKLADGARDAFNQQRHFASRQKIAQERERFERAFLDAVSNRFDQLGAAAPKPAPPTHMTLSLLDTAEQEMTNAIDQLTSRGDKRSGPLLYELSFRLAVLVGLPPLDGEQIPVAPRALAHSLREAQQAIDLPQEHELLLLKSLESTLLYQSPRLYARMSTQLIAEGILTELRPVSIQRAAAVQPPRTTSSDDARRPDSEPMNAETPGSRQADAHAGIYNAGPYNPSGYNANSNNGFGYTPASFNPNARSTNTAASSGAEPIAVLDSLRELLAQRHPAPGPANSAAEPIATPDELQTALQALQQHLTQVTDHASRELRSAQRLREELLSQLNANKLPGAKPTRLSPEQGDTVELVAMLFEQLSKQLHQGEPAQQVLGGLQVPVLRMAVSDRDFFDQPEHPARQLLGTVTEAAHDWLDDSGSDADRSLRTKLEQLVDRASRETPSAGLYTSLLADIDQHLLLLTRKAQAAERRHVEAMQGRERLEQSRVRASELMSERFAKSAPRGLLRALLDRAWSDVLALTLLRHGEASEAFANQLRITDELLGHTPVTDRAQLQQDVETGLQQIGMHHEEASQVSQRLVNPDEVPPPAPGGEVLSNTDLALRLKQHHRLGENKPPASAPPQPTEHVSALARASSATAAKRAADALRKPGVRSAAPEKIKLKPAPSPREMKLQEQLRLLPFGTWFELTDPDTGKTIQRKLAWYSPVSGHALFVNRRGQRSEEVTLPQLAHEMAHGRAQQVIEEKESLLDRAWQKLTGSLMRPAGRSTETPGTPGGRRA